LVRPGSLTGAIVVELPRPGFIGMLFDTGVKTPAPTVAVIGEDSGGFVRENGHDRCSGNIVRARSPQGQAGNASGRDDAQRASIEFICGMDGAAPARLV
jgi:hypothetical protein